MLTISIRGTLKKVRKGKYVMKRSKKIGNDC